MGKGNKIFSSTWTKSVNVDWIKVYVMLSKNGNVKNSMIGVLIKINISGILKYVIVNVVRYVKLINI